MTQGSRGGMVGRDGISGGSTNVVQEFLQLQERGVQILRCLSLLSSCTKLFRGQHETQHVTARRFVPCQTPGSRALKYLQDKISRWF